MIEIKEIEQILDYYKNRIKQNKFKLILIYIKDYYRKFKNYIFSILRFFQRTQEFTKVRYNRIWNKTDLKIFYDPENTNNCSIHSYKDSFFLSSNALSTRIHQYLVINKINELKPNSVLEVGCGQGFQLLLLSRLYPEINFFGIDQSDEGIMFAKKFAQKKIIEEELTKPLKYNFNNSETQNINYSIQDAKKLEFESNSIDLIFTNLALEQMDNIKFEVLSEIKRVSSKYIVLIEPFKDLNNSGIKYLHHSSKQYFNLKYNELVDENYAIVDYQKNFPSQISLNYGLLVLKKL
ncbi:class I SAM-dependent methyltransferase [Candidatus Pelagibacter ubique]|nr:class I SAM-dependent methyltransferase [Candidatus Pelagibacter ubique]